VFLDDEIGFVRPGTAQPGRERLAQLVQAAQPGLDVAANSLCARICPSVAKRRAGSFCSARSRMALSSVGRVGSTSASGGGSCERRFSRISIGSLPVKGALFVKSS
jgi:hypothetical protein